MNPVLGVDWEDVVFEFLFLILLNGLHSGLEIGVDELLIPLFRTWLPLGLSRTIRRASRDSSWLAASSSRRLGFPSPPIASEYPSIYTN